MLKIEAEFISAFSVRSRGGFLTNRVRLNPENINRYIKINIPDGCYEKAQMVLMLMKSAAMELAKANPHGISNSDAAKYLGLQSDYSGGSKDYLSYSIMGLLMKDRCLKRIDNREY